MATTTAGVPMAASAKPDQHNRSFIHHPSNNTPGEATIHRAGRE
jgi:hypothetical protein